MTKKKKIPRNNHKNRKKSLRSPIFVYDKSAKISNWLPPYTKETTNIRTYSWFDAKFHKNINAKQISYQGAKIPIIPPDSLKEQLKAINKQKNEKRNKNKVIDKEPAFIYTRKITIHPTAKQKEILDIWFDATADMFNSTIDYIRRNIFINGAFIGVKDARKFLGVIKIRNSLTDIRDNIQLSTSPHKIPIHILDEAIKQAVANHKTCVTNYQKGHIKKFRLREWSYNRNRKILKIEKEFFRDNTFCPSIFDEFKATGTFAYIDSTVTLQYNKTTKKYILLVPVKDINTSTIMKPRVSCGIDLGVRTFAAVYSTKGTYEICNRDNNKKRPKNANKYMYNHFANEHKKIDRINEILSNNKLKRLQEQQPFVDDLLLKNEILVPCRKKIDGKFVTVLKIKKINRQKLKRGLRKYHERIKNKVKDMHFKISYGLVNKFDSIYIGKLSTSKILANKSKTKVSKETKRMISALSPYLFRQRLIFMGYKYGTKVHEVDEFLTTKTCSRCGRLNEVGVSEKYICKCGLKTGRDINAAKNILKVGRKNIKMTYKQKKKFSKAYAAIRKKQKVDKSKQKC